MAEFAFDERNIRWKQIDGIDHLWLSVLDVDDGNGVMHVMLKFSANQKIILHRHLTLNKTITIQGEHRLYHADGRLKEVRPVGTCVISPASDEPHREGGGDQDAIILFIVYGNGALYEALDDESNVIMTLCAQDFIDLYDRVGR
ncbi:MAG: regulator [Methylocystis sp.]|uniref:regulator n=1 Tax=Methylocystis sp. TaxID=1911079 RepID=UPI003D0FF998